MPLLWMLYFASY